MKIFGIGLSKTGTTSLARALEILGYSVKDNLGVIRYARGDLSTIDSCTLDANDAFTDTPIPSFYRELDIRYPNSKFILTVRNMNEWLASCKKQFNEKLAAKQNDAHKQLFFDLYGCNVFDESKFRIGYETFVAEVLEYFKEDPQRLLILDIAAGEGWEKLCPFLGQATPDCPFPKANVTQIRWMSIHDVIAVAREAGEQTYRAQQMVHVSPKRQSFGALRAFKRWAAVAMRGGNTRLLHTAKSRAHRLIIKRLATLNPRIPIVSPQSDVLPPATRRTWNHFWLVDPTDSDKSFFDGQTFTVNIALIEDGTPIVGVVHAPALDTTYYAMRGKKALKIEGSGEPTALKQQSIDVPEPSSVRPETGLVSVALGVCLAAEGRGSRDPCFPNTMEWQTAAAHAVLSSAGGRLKSRRTKGDLTYNKDDLANEPTFVS